MLTGFVHVSAITNLHYRRVLGWQVMASKETGLVDGALEQALAIRRQHGSAFAMTDLEHHFDGPAVCVDRIFRGTAGGGVSITTMAPTSGHLIQPRIEERSTNDLQLRTLRALLTAGAARAMPEA